MAGKAKNMHQRHNFPGGGGGGVGVGDMAPRKRKNLGAKFSERHCLILRPILCKLAIVVLR